MVRVYLSYQGNSLELPQGESVVGRDPLCRLRLHAPWVSRRHARFRVQGDAVEIEDLGSRNGTFVNGRRVVGTHRLDLGDEIAFGERRMVILMEDAEVDFEPITAVKDAPEGGESETPARVTQEIPPEAAPLGRDRRRHPRREIEIPIVYESQDLQVEAFSMNLSQSGVFIRTPILDAVGTDCRLIVRSEELGSFTLAGKVRRVVDVATGEEPLGLGIEFSDVEDGARRWLEGKLAPRQGARAQS